MDVAPLDLCRELYALAPGWNDTDYSWFIDDLIPDDGLLGCPRSEPSIGRQGSRIGALYSEVPAYDVGYLLRKLPDGYGLVKVTAEYWRVFEARTMQAHHDCTAEAPETAVVALCIKLWRQGILTERRLMVTQRAR